MKPFIFFLASFQLLCIQQKGSAQPLDTLLTDFRSIESIFPVDDSTFILIGLVDSSCRVARIDARANYIWSVKLYHSEDYQLKSFDVHVNENDSSIQVLMYPFECDFHPAGTELLTTLDFDGNLIDWIEIYDVDPFEPCFLLSGQEGLPKYARIIEDRVVLFFSNGDTTILDLPIPNDPLLTPILVDMCPSGDVSVCFDLLNRIMIYRNIEGRYRPVSGGPTVEDDFYNLICIDHNRSVLVDRRNIYLADTNGVVLNSFGPTVFLGFKVQWKKPFIYPDYHSTRDSFYVLDADLNIVHILPENHSQRINDYVTHNNYTYKAGLEFIYPYSGHLESENQITHEGPKLYDVDFIDYYLDLPDSVSTSSLCNQVPVYHFPELRIDLKNKGDYGINEITVHAEDFQGCCKSLSWDREITDMNLLPGETRTFTLDSISLAWISPSRFNICFSVLRPDQHADDKYLNNGRCRDVILTALPQAGNTTFPTHFPNPVSDKLNFHFDGVNPFHVRLYNLQGELILYKQIIDSNDAMDVNALTPGIYFLQYSSEEGIGLVEKVVKM